MKWLESQDFSKHLRKAMTSAEYLLWQLIRNRQRCNAKFRRQYVEGTYLLDFYCPEAKLCVECDGLPHFTPEGIETDRIRTGWFNEQGIEVIRFTSQEIENDTQDVLQEIDQALKRLLKQWSAPHPPTPTPSEYRREGELVHKRRAQHEGHFKVAVNCSLRPGKRAVDLVKSLLGQGGTTVRKPDGRHFGSTILPNHPFRSFGHAFLQRQRGE